MKDVAAVVDAYRLHPIVLVCSEVLECERAAVLLCECGDFFSKLAFIECLAFRFCDALKRFRLRAKRKLLTGLGRTAARHERVGEPRLRLKLLHLVGPGRAIVGVTMKPSAAYLIAGSNRSTKGSLPNFAERSRHALTHPGIVTESQPRWGIAGRLLKRSKVQPAGDRPDALRPCSFLPSHRMQNASLPMPLLVGSTTVSAIAAASARPPRSHL